jgi:hypothetical protein
MTDRRPPAAATWFMTRCLPSETREALVGDLMESFDEGRSSSWYWSQALRAVAASIVSDGWQSGAMAGIAFAIGVYLNDIFMVVVRPSAWIYWLDAWYRQLIRLLLVLEWDGVRHAAYDLGLGFLTIRIVWCLWVAAVAWSLTRLSGRRRAPALVMVIVQLWQGVRLVLPAGRDWLGDPVTAYSALNLLWYAAFLLLAAPLSACVGARWGAGGARVMPSDH